MGLLFQERAGVPMLHVPYRGGGQMMSDLLAGQLDLELPTYTNFKSLLGERQVKALAIARATRWTGTPDVPTLVEQGYQGIDVDNFFGIAGPKGLPADIVQKLNEAFVQASRDPELAQKLEELGIIAITSKPSDLTKLLVDDTARLPPIIKKLGIKP
jgi:tripartite-type tricarboxylate transporter receptor subunit TctC